MNQFLDDQKYKIFIGGDSWGCGEWNPTKDQEQLLLHNGIEQYFKEAGYHVTNSSRGGLSNRNTIQLLDQQLCINYASGDTVFWIQTDPIRDLRPYKQLTEQILEADGLFNLCQQTLQLNYHTLNDVAAKHQTTIHVIGGKFDLDPATLTKFKNLNALVPSWCQLLVGNKYHDRFPHGTNTDWVIGDIDLDTYHQDFRYKIVNEMYHLELCYEMYKEAIFQPDGYHPNRQGHQVLFDFIVKELNL